MYCMRHFYESTHMGENWFTFDRLYKAMVDRFPSGSHFVEVGCWKGRSAAFMAVEIANSGKDIRLDCIDSWPDISVMEDFLVNMAPVEGRFRATRMDSAEAASLYGDGSLSFVFLDADHSFDGLCRDLLAWLPKMAPNSVFAGHDYEWHEPVRRACREILGPRDLYDPWGDGCFFYEI